MRALALVLALTACGFQTRGAPDAGSLELDASEPQQGPGADAAAAAFCDPGDSHLMACYELDGSGRDGSSHHLDAVVTNATFPPGKVGQAMLFAATSTADVADSPVFDVTALTLEAWIHLAELPTGTARAGIVDMNGQYGLFLHANGDLQCALGGGASPPATAAHVALDEWTHVACSYDGAAGALYVNGVAIANAAGGGALPTGGTTGISLAADNPPGSGSRLSGLIDQVRLFDVASTALQICQDAGRASCP